MTLIKPTGSVVAVWANVPAASSERSPTAERVNLFAIRVWQTLAALFGTFNGKLKQKRAKKLRAKGLLGGNPYVFRPKTVEIP